MTSNKDCILNFIQFFCQQQFQAMYIPVMQATKMIILEVLDEIWIFRHNYVVVKLHKVNSNEISSYSSSVGHRRGRVECRSMLMTIIFMNETEHWITTLMPILPHLKL